MDVRNEEQEWVQLVIQGDTRMGDASLACKVAYLRLPRPRDLELKGSLLP